MAPMDSLICTPTGFIKMRDVKVGDRVTDPATGGATNVIQIHPQGIKPIWRFIFDDGAAYESGEEHLWAYRRSNTQRPGTKASSERELCVEVFGTNYTKRKWETNRIGTTAELKKLFDDGEAIRIPLSEPIFFNQLRANRNEHLERAQTMRLAIFWSVRGSRKVNRRK